MVRGLAIQTFMLAICIIHYIDGLAWGVVLSCATGLPEPLKTDNPNSPTLSFCMKFLPGLWGINNDLMRKYLLLLFTIGLFTGCNDYDDGKLWDSVNDLEARPSVLEKQCKEMNANIESMKVIVDVLQSNDYVTNVTVVAENGVEIGYKVDFKVHPSITIYHGKAGETPRIGENGNWWVGNQDTGVKAKGEDGGQGQTPHIGSNGNWWIGTEDTGVKAKGEDGKDGKDGVTPVIGIKLDNDGIYYWTQQTGTSGGYTWIVDDEGNKIKARGEDGIAPQLRIEDDNWMLSVDNGQTWQNLGKAKGDGESFFKNVTNDKNDLILELKDGTIINLPKKQAFSFTLDKTQLPLFASSTSYSIHYTIEGEEKLQANIETVAPDGWRVSVTRKNSYSGSISVVTPSNATEGKVLVFVADGKGNTLMQTLSFVKGNLSVDLTEHVVWYRGKDVVLHVTTDVDYEVKIASEDKDWIWLRDNQNREKFTLAIQANSRETYRYAIVELVNEGGSVLERISITQEPAVTKNIHVATAGTLSKIMYDKKWDVNVKITGQLNASDYTYLKSIKDLKVLDLSDLDVTVIPPSAFSGSTLEKVRLPKKLTIIPERAFYNSKIMSIEIPENVTEIGEYAFYGCVCREGSLVIPNRVETIAAYAFFGCKGSRTLTLSLRLKEIKEYAFANGGFIGTLTIPPDVLKIGNCAFQSCVGFTKLELNENLLIIGEGAFQLCKGFKGDLVIPDKVQMISRGAFWYCTGLQGDLIIGENVTEIDESAFAMPGNLGGMPDKPLNVDRIYFKCTTPPSGMNDCFGDKSNKLNYVAVPSGSKGQYVRVFGPNRVELLEEVEF